MKLMEPMERGVRHGRNEVHREPRSFFLKCSGIANTFGIPPAYLPFVCDVSVGVE